MNLNYKISESAVLEAAALTLALHGWESDRLLRHVTTKTFETAAGFKPATLRMDLVSDENVYWLTGCYFSEGRNILTSVYAFISVVEEPEYVVAAVEKVLAQAEKLISETYAVRLLRKQIGKMPQAKSFECVEHILMT